jgi:hypoxanthine phosphoribosyltransferase
MNPTPQEHISSHAIAERMTALAEQIAQDTQASSQPLVLVGILKGALYAVADLSRALGPVLPQGLEVELIRVSSYVSSGEGHAMHSSGRVQPVDLSLPSLTGRDVLLVEDIVDTGLSMQFVVDYLQQVHQPARLRVMTVLDKPSARSNPQLPKLDYVGFTVANAFWVGYGLDADGRYRELPYIGVL